MINLLLIQLAQSLNVGTDPKTQVNIPNISADQVLHNGLNIAYFLAGTIAVIVIIVGGLTYSTSGGDGTKLTKAKNMILYAVIGLVVVLTAFAITNFVSGRFNQ